MNTYNITSIVLGIKIKILHEGKGMRNIQEMEMKYQGIERGNTDMHMSLPCARHGDGRQDKEVKMVQPGSLEAPQLKGRQTHRPRRRLWGPTGGCDVIVLGKLRHASKRG